MKVQTKILLLLLVVGALFGGGLVALRLQDRTKFRRISQERALERKKFFDEFLTRRSEPLQMLAKDYTYWDDMARAIGGSDIAWVTQHTSDNNWNSFNVDAVWIYHPDQSLFFSANRLDADGELKLIPLPAGAFAELAHQRFMHFYLPVKEGIMEVSAATVHPSSDSLRQTPLQGYFFAARLWNKETVSLLSRDTDNEITLQPATRANATSAEDDAESGIVTFSRTLAGWDGKPVARLLVRNDSKIINELNNSNGQLLKLLVAFAGLTVVLLTVSLMRWVSRPLRLISRTLESEHLGPVDKLHADRSEFGGVARMIREFFGQREKLIAEINERKSTQEALRQSGEQLRQAQKMEAVGRLAGGVAHDFNNLLTAILGYAELLAVRRDLDTVARQHVETIQQAGKQAAAVTHQLLAFSRKQMLQPRVLDLGALVHDFEKILRRVIGEHIELIVETEGGTRVKADPNQLEQVILNLGVNGRDAMPKGGQLCIRTSCVRLDEAAARRQAPDLGPGHYVKLEVSDTGHGMDEETKARIFEPFFTTKNPGKGTGLGLATVYGVVKQSGGTVTVESTPGAGCTFRVLLPREESELEEERPKSTAPTQTPASRADTVLVVEDEEIVRELVCSVLKERGYHVLCAANGNEALKMSEEHKGKIALLITDVVMPQMGGLELSRFIATTRPETHVLYVSGYSESDMNDQGILAPDADFMEKPFTPQALTRKVREVLNPTLVPIQARDGQFAAHDGLAGHDGHDGHDGHHGHDGHEREEALLVPPRA